MDTILWYITINGEVYIISVRELVIFFATCIISGVGIGLVNAFWYDTGI